MKSFKVLSVFFTSETKTGKNRDNENHLLESGILVESGILEAEIKYRFYVINAQ